MKTKTLLILLTTLILLTGCLHLVEDPDNVTEERFDIEQNYTGDQLYDEEILESIGDLEYARDGELYEHSEIYDRQKLEDDEEYLFNMVTINSLIMNEEINFESEKETKTFNQGDYQEESQIYRSDHNTGFHKVRQILENSEFREFIDQQQKEYHTVHVLNDNFQDYQVQNYEEEFTPVEGYDLFNGLLFERNEEPVILSKEENKEQLLENHEIDISGKEEIVFYTGESNEFIFPEGNNKIIMGIHEETGIALLQYFAVQNFEENQEESFRIVENKLIVENIGNHVSIEEKPEWIE